VIQRTQPGSVSCVNAQHPHELIGVFVKSYQGTTDSVSCDTREPTTFCLVLFFIFFLEFISQIRENEQKLGRMRFSQVTFCCGMTPYLIRDHFLPDLNREARQQRYRLDLNQDLSKFRGRNERPESKWELDSRNVPYGIFCATPKKRAR
jgi:hypothetical protein